MTPASSRAKFAVFALFLAACGAEQHAETAASSGNASGATSSGGVMSGDNTTATGGVSTAEAAGAGTNAGGNTTAAAGSSVTGDSGGAAGSAGAGPMDASGIPDDATVVLFLIDGLQTATIATGIANGASNIKFLIDNGVTAETVYSTSPAARLELPDASLPWGNATSGNVAVHTGCHLFESNQMDDIFLAAKKAGIKSVFAGGDANYAVFTTADYDYSGMLADAEVVQHAIDHLQNDHVRLVRLHLQRIRDFWNGPTSETTASSPYIQHLIEADGLLGNLRQALETAGVWNHTYLILSSDHGMGQAGGSEHPPSTLSSWKNVMIFYGPNVKKGATIPYAESPDLGVLTNHLLKLPPLQGHTDPKVTLARPGEPALCSRTSSKASPPSCRILATSSST
jgi:Type I phosphodiesterase / nucleotide pyrophosphatase